jgi:hypothetical protein
MALTDSWNGREDGIQLGGFEHLCNPTGLVSPPRLCQDDSNETGQQQPAPHAPCTAPPPSCLPKCPTRADFKDIHVLGSGSFGDVMLAVNRCTGQKVRPLPLPHPTPSQPFQVCPRSFHTTRPNFFIQYLPTNVSDKNSLSHEHTWSMPWLRSGMGVGGTQNSL